jgi:hypothetical protein
MSQPADRSRTEGRERPRDLRGWYELGKEVRTKADGTCGVAGMIRRLNEELRYTGDQVQKAVAFARGYSPGELEELCRLRTPDGKPLTYSHVRRLLSVENKTKRARLQRRAAEAGWSHEGLAAQIAADRGRAVPFGRRPAVPSDLTAALRDILARTKEWLNRSTTSWNGLGDGEDPLKPALEPLLRQSKSVLRELQRAARALERRLDGLATGAGRGATPQASARGSGRGRRADVKPAPRVKGSGRRKR